MYEKGAFPLNVGRGPRRGGERALSCLALYLGSLMPVTWLGKWVPGERMAEESYSTLNQNPPFAFNPVATTGDYSHPPQDATYTRQVTIVTRHKMARRPDR